MLLGEERSYHLYGIKAIHGMILRMPWTDPEHFPTGTLCELEIRDQSRIHSYVVQCVLSINIFNEKIFVFLWFWFFVLITITSLDLIIWFVHNFYWEGATKYEMLFVVHFVYSKLNKEFVGCLILVVKSQCSIK